MPTAFLSQLALIPTVLFVWTTFATAADGEPAASERRAIARLIAKTLSAFPPDTETIVVGRSFVILGDKEPADPSFFEFVQSGLPRLALGPLLEVDKGQCGKLLIGQKVSMAMLGGRKFESVSTFGALRYHGCAIVRFVNDLGETGDKLVKLLRADAKRIDTVAGQEVFVFESTTTREPYVKVEPWEADFVVRLAPDVLLTGTSAAFIAEALSRWDETPADRALPDDLAEWKFVDTSARAFLVRHPWPIARGQKPVASGMVFQVPPSEGGVVEFFYLPSDEQKCEVLIRRRWPKNMGLSPEVRRFAADAIRATIPFEERPGMAKLGWLSLICYSSQGERFVLDSDPR